MPLADDLFVAVIVDAVQQGTRPEVGHDARLQENRESASVVGRSPTPYLTALSSQKTGSLNLSGFDPSAHPRDRARLRLAPLSSAFGSPLWPSLGSDVCLRVLLSHNRGGMGTLEGRIIRRSRDRLLFTDLITPFQ